MTLTKKDAYIRLKLQNHSLTFIHKNKSLRSATSILSRSPMSYNTTASLVKLTRTDNADFGKSQDRFGQFSGSKNDSNYLDVKLKVFNKDDNKEFQLVQSLTMGEVEFNPVFAIEESAGQNGRKLCLRGTLVPSADTYNVQRFG